ncbi:amidase domain-containing protein [Virgibacillus soli]|uniref:Amidase domain-containing protein n=1 Tax=Paracerasibacillus soli TaxID=480284 RepID=A0ABU5CN41_9BACI|nr:amidase domain-containing protein [Virgibacillus soli]MDY0407773.1 amidase domain-containing protein [Virgibacillus soli]
MEILQQYWMDSFNNVQLSKRQDDWWSRLDNLCKKRNAEIVKINGQGHIFHQLRQENIDTCHYQMHLTFLIKQDEHLYVEERVTPFTCTIRDGNIVKHEEILNVDHTSEDSVNAKAMELVTDSTQVSERFTYNRQQAVQYAEHWWNSYNPTYRVFDVDCTNFISQCLHAGGAPMWGTPNRSKGWWYQGNNWSYSWAVAHSMRWYLSGATQGVKGVEMESPEELLPGDVICYDFQGDGRWDHTTIVVAKDAYGMPLVNAHTDNSRHRYWSYEDSTAWTPNIKYKFFHIQSVT